MIMFCGFSIGAALGGWVVAQLIVSHGWQVVFLIGGVIPLVLAAVLALFLPESPRFLVSTGKHPQRLVRYLNRLAPGTISPGGFVPLKAEKPATGLVVRDLFDDGRTRMTLLLWAITFMGLLDLNLLSSWLTTLLHDSGLSLETAATVTIGYQIGGTLGNVLLGRFVDRRPPFLVLVVTFVVAFAGIVGIGFAGTDVMLLSVLIFVVGFCVIGGIGASDALVATCYPTGMRVTGLGWAIGIGRIGAILGPTLGGLALSMGANTTHFFMIGALPILGAAAAAWAVHVSSRNVARIAPPISGV
jgi:AAHS family 4-hydroxybenzoate transporter-like MFS transporter